MPAPLLDVKGLETQFKTPDGIVHAVNGVSFSLEEGETLGLVGESGCGKSVTMLSVLRLIAMPPGKIVAGEAFFRGQDLLKMSKEEIRHVRGAQIAMVFQDPMTSLEPGADDWAADGRAVDAAPGHEQEAGPGRVRPNCLRWWGSRMPRIG